MNLIELTPAQMAERTGVPIDTLRYYEKEGLLRNVGRADSGHRRYSEDDVLWVDVLRCLRNTGMTIDQLRRYCELGAQGDHTAPERRQILLDHRAAVEEQITERRARPRADRPQDQLLRPRPGHPRPPHHLRHKSPHQPQHLPRWGQLMAFGAVTTEPYVQLGRTGLFVHRVGLGTMQFGWTVEEPGAFAVMDAYAELGGNFIDTADCYTSWSSRMSGQVNAGGVSEEILGRWMAARGNRDQIVVATKVRAAMGVDFGEHRGTAAQREGLSRRWIMKACEDSLRRLGVDHIDLYQAHFIDPLVPISETMAAFTDLVRQGKVRYLGCSNYSAWRLMESLWASDRRNLESFVSLQPEYNLLDPTRGDVESELAPMCERYGIGIIPYSPLAGGLLTGKYRREQPLPDSARAEENAEVRFSERNWDIIETLVSVADEAGVTPAHAAIDWLRSKPWVTAPDRRGQPTRSAARHDRSARRTAPGRRPRPARRGVGLPSEPGLARDLTDSKRTRRQG